MITEMQNDAKDCNLLKTKSIHNDLAHKYHTSYYIIIIVIVMSMLQLISAVCTMESQWYKFTRK
jgi:hypothetical protein